MFHHLDYGLMPLPVHCESCAKLKMNIKQLVSGCCLLEDSVELGKKGLLVNKGRKKAHFADQRKT
jgi:hypothetical protein